MKISSSLTFAAATVLAVLCAALVKSSMAMDLVLLPDSVALQTGAVCLDGTSPGYYFRKATNAADANKWIIFFQGGGWCYTPEDCLARSKTRLGSNKFWSPSIQPQGVMGADPAHNPDFYGYNVAYFQYCDGASFSGDAASAAVVGGERIWYRGHRIKDALLADLFQHHNLGKADTVLISGCSAGGLSTYLHADAVHALFDSSVTVKAMAGSGYFMDWPNVDKTYVYTMEMGDVFHFQNASHGVNEACVASQPADQQWRCMMAQYTYPHIKTDFFIMNSAYDEWQMGNIVGIDVPSFTDCAFHGYTDCTTAQMIEANAFHDNMINVMKSTPKFRQPRQGAFVHSCWNHCAASGDASWDVTAIDGTTMREAVANWFFERNGTDTTYTHIGCRVDPANREACNPTCAH